MEKRPVSEEQKAAYDRLLATRPDVERKVKNLLYTSVNGHPRVLRVQYAGVRHGA